MERVRYLDIHTWEEDRYNSVFESTCNTLERRLQHEQDFTVEQVESMLQALYIREGNDWTGRGITADITLSATIAAHQHVLVQMKKDT